MKAEFWHERWEANQRGFHQNEVNDLLKRHWKTLGVAAAKTAFVPLCGKSLDMRWLREQGHPVLGVEFSRQGKDVSVTQTANVGRRSVCRGSMRIILRTALIAKMDEIAMTIA